jgi:hypothetical protein
MGPADRPLADVETVVHERDERIVVNEVVWCDDLCRQMPRANEAGCG